MTSFKIVTNHSVIRKYDENPIQTSYDLLWSEIRDTANINKLTIFKTLRRILEYYFKILGKIKDDAILDKFDGEDKVICNALLSWINDGSHLINDDMFVSTDHETVEKYLFMFRKIFEAENQIEHYNMMMKI
jgi:wobble nucleotide-excising tRNase